MIDIRKTNAFAGWMRRLKDRTALAKIAVRLDRLADGHFGDVKSVGEGIRELRIHYGPGYRIYFTRRGDTLIILLCGGNKNSQAKDIRTAQTLAAQLED